MRCGSRSREGEEKIEHTEGMGDTVLGQSQQDKLMSSVLKEERNDSFHLCSSKDTLGQYGRSRRVLPWSQVAIPSLPPLPTSTPNSGLHSIVLEPRTVQ